MRSPLTVGEFMINALKPNQFVSLRYILPSGSFGEVSSSGRHGYSIGLKVYWVIVCVG